MLLSQQRGRWLTQGHSWLICITSKKKWHMTGAMRGSIVIMHPGSTRHATPWQMTREPPTKLKTGWGIIVVMVSNSGCIVPSR